MSEHVSMEQLVSLCKRRGFVFPGSEIYGGLANTWDYGPLGAQLKMNLKAYWWKRFVEQRADMVGLDGSIIMNPAVWKASGHVDTFNDPLVECKTCHKRFRADHLLEEKGIEPRYMREKPMSAHDIACPACGGELTDPRDFNMMFKTFIGPAEDSAEAVYLRPETAQAMFVNFVNVLDTSRKRLPFGIAQIGKAFRNEITPGNFTFRTLEFEQMEIEYFIEEAQWQEVFETWAVTMEAFAKEVGVDVTRLHRLEVSADDLAHYSKRTVDFEFDYPFGTKELWGLAYRTDFDLKNHQQHSGQRLEYTDPYEQSKKIIPHVVEPTMGVDRTMLAILLSAYHEETVGEGEKQETRVVMKFAPAMAPYKAAVLPLSKKEELTGPAHELHERLLKRFAVEYDETQSIGKRYRRQDEIGTPYCITVDFETLNDQAVTVRDRDTMQQERVALVELEAWLAERLG